jgi:hypothetical protein
MASYHNSGDRRESYIGGKEQWHDSGVGSDDDDNMDGAEKERRDYRPNDVESQIPSTDPQQPPDNFEQEVSTRTKLLYLGVYFFFNLTLTIYNKAVLGKVGFMY